MIKNSICVGVIWTLLITLLYTQSFARSPICIQGEFNPDQALMLAWGDQKLGKDKAVWNLAAFISAHPAKKKLFENSVTFETSGLAISRPDKILRLVSDGSSIILLAGTVPYDLRKPDSEQSYSCSACEPLLGAQLWRQDGGQWCLMTEDRAITLMGGAGHLTYGRVEVVKVGPEKNGLLFEDEGSHGGHSLVRSILLLPTKTGFAVPFDKITAEDNLGMYGKHDKRSFQYTAKISFMPESNREYFDLKIVTAGTRIDKSGGRMPWNTKKIYAMQEGEYILKTERPVASNGQSKK